MQINIPFLFLDKFPNMINNEAVTPHLTWSHMLSYPCIKSGELIIVTQRLF